MAYRIFHCGPHFPLVLTRGLQSVQTQQLRCTDSVVMEHRLGSYGALTQELHVRRLSSHSAQTQELMVHRLRSYSAQTQ